jgi:predicted DNA-binding antitoxin AbrB/MazE fold protein
MMTTPIRAIYEEGRLRLLDPVELTEGEEVSIAILRAAAADTGSGFSARDLLRMPPIIRDEILARAAAQAEHEYRTDPDLTGFEAFGDDDLYDETP